MVLQRLKIVAPLAVLLVALGCGQKDKQETGASDAAAAASDTGLTPFQIENGIGPVTEPVAVGPVDHEMAERGEKLFESKCSACHKLDQRYVGPPLGQVTERRTPAYVMNMILNPDGMYSKHPAARQLLGEYMTQMPNLNLTRDEARDLLEYFRSVDTTAGK
jgi:cytochrome c